ncbi:MAG TPA: hydrogen peroxide-dependent heme synthase [Candidatus Polarisedimenticolia bacterium]|nr:hydrogen peroxide-dependent heme synthase [Candidatus Polarisedimenticolia bacterium]
MHNPQVPETLEGWSLLHQMFRVRWETWKALEASRRRSIAEEAAALLGAMEARQDGASALVSLLGHKGDLMLIHFRRSFEDLSQAELQLARSELFDHLVPTTSYVSIVELGMYEMTGKIHQDLATQGLKTGSEEFERAFDEEIGRQRERVAGRLFCEIPRRRHVCFYPMNKRRGEEKNWYMVPFEKRAVMMREHGFIGRAYSGQVTQIISGSIGLDDWEWGVDLFADDPLVFKKLIYEMRFDEASAEYAEFGPFYVGLQFRAREIPRLLEGATPAWD